MLQASAKIIHRPSPDPACRESSVTPTPPPGAVPPYAPQVTMSGNHVGKTTSPYQSGVTVYPTVRGMAAARLITPARCPAGQPPPGRPYAPPACRAGAR
jgi:hypothetical protein